MKLLIQPLPIIAASLRQEAPFVGTLRTMIFTLALATLGLMPSTARAYPVTLGLHLSPCTQGHAKVPARCGSFGVFEDHAAESGRFIQLGVIILSATHPVHDAIAVIAGGPGQSVTPFAAAIADGDFYNGLLSLRDHYDILFVDDRGMGLSHPFDCDFAPTSAPSSYFLHLWPEKLLTDCRTKTSETHDQDLYNTNASVDDLNDVRAALGYSKLVLDGGSYGTFFSLVYMRRHPESVESAILDGVSAPHFQPLPGSADGAQLALDDLIATCAHDTACRAHFSQFAQHFQTLAKRLDAGNLPVPVMNSATKRLETVALSKEVFVDSLRHVLYDPFASGYVPYVIERAYARDYAPLGQMVDVVVQGFSQGLDQAANLSYSCADWMPFLDSSEVQTAAEHSFAGDLRIRAQRKACALWNVQPMPQSFNDPVRSAAPVLMISSSNDPGTPRRYGEEALRYLPNGREVLITGGGHAAETPCTDRLVVQFVRARSAKGLDVSQCGAAADKTIFATSMKGWPQV